VPPDRQEALGHLDAALDALSAARAALGGSVPSIPVEGLGDALIRDEKYGEAKAALVQTHQDLEQASEDGQALLDAEAAMNHLAVQAARVGWQLAWVCGARAVR